MGGTPAPPPDTTPGPETEEKAAIERLFDGDADPASDPAPTPGGPKDA